MKTRTITTLVKKVSLVALVFASFTAIAQEEEEKKWFDNFSLSGSVDGYFRANLGADFGEAPATSFAGSPGFSLGMVNTVLSYEGEKVGFVADLVYGPRGEEAVFLSNPSSNIVNQLYVYWNVSESVKLTFGNFNTYLGYEVISPTGNFNYSTSYMFSYGPFSHTGLKVDFALGEEWSAALAIMNPTDVTESNPFDTYIVGGQLGYSTDGGSAYLNFRYGTEGFPGESTVIVDGTPVAINLDPTFQVDLTTGWDVSEDFYLGVNATYLTNGKPEINGVELEDALGFYGVALYPQYKTSDSFTIGLRGEYFAEYGGGVGALALDEEGDGSVFAATLTGSYNVGSLTFKPELRLDSASEETFADGDEFSKSLASFVLGAVYSF